MNNVWLPHSKGLLLLTEVDLVDYSTRVSINLTLSVIHGQIRVPSGESQRSRIELNMRTIVKRRKLQWYGHVSRSSGLAKTLLQGTVKGGRRQGGQRKRWEDNIREWTGLEFGKSQRAVENGENGENWLQNHLWCPNDPRG